MSQDRFVLTKSQFPRKTITVFFNGKDVSYKCSRAYVPRAQGVTARGWVEMRWDSGSAPERYDGDVMWLSEDKHA